MTKMKSTTLIRGLAISAAIAIGTLSATSLGAQQASKVRIIQTNYGGDIIHIIDPATNKVVQTIKGPFEAAHGVIAAPDGSRIYISEEGSNSVKVIDGKSLQVT